MKSGNDSQPATGPTVNSVGQPSGGSSKTSSTVTKTTSSTPSVTKPGDLKAIKNVVVNNLVQVAETKSKHPMSPAGREALVHFIDSATKGYVGSLGMICKGPQCPFISDCPLNNIKSQLPIGDKCPVENAMVTMWLNKHLKALGIEDPNDPIHSFDMDMLYELAGQELIRWRCSVHLSDDPRLVSNQQVGATQQGEPIFGDVINPVLDVMERAGKNISKIREALVATREAQIKAGQLASDPTERAAELKKKANDFIEKRRKANEKLKDAEFKITDTKE
tara:strand:+ start:48300 stop:49133 length:834 start_codon:yes stop_codon:yes gene_type:complete